MNDSFKQANENESSFSDFFIPLTTKKAISYIFILGFVVFFNMLFNNFVWDDLLFIIYNPQVHQFNLPFLFGPNIFNVGLFYRPIPAVYFTMLYMLGGINPFLYHFIQLVLHLIDTSLLYIFFTTVFPEFLAFFLSLIFLVHPINVESVSYIASSQSEIYFFFGVSALLLARSPNLSKIRITFISLLLMLSILTKETGFLFLILLPVYRYIFKLKGVKKVIFSETGITVIYIFSRVFVGKVMLQKLNYIPIAALPFSQRLLNIPAIFIYYLKTFLIPQPLIAWQIWVVKSPMSNTFLFPLIICFILTAFTLFLGYVFYKEKKSKAGIKNNYFALFLFFLLWYLAGMGMLSQIIPLDMTVADRWFYLPIVGVLGVIGVTANYFMSKGSRYNTILLIIILCFIGGLSVRTIIRNADWYSEITFMTKSASLQDSFLIEETLGAAYANQADYKDSLYHFKKSLTLFPFELAALNTGRVYEIYGNVNEAEKYYSLALHSTPFATVGHKHIYSDYDHLAKMLIIKGDFKAALQVVHEGLQDYNDNSQSSTVSLWVLLGITEYELGNHSVAIRAVNHSLGLLPNNPLLRDTYNRMLRSERIDVKNLFKFIPV